MDSQLGFHFDSDKSNHLSPNYGTRLVQNQRLTHHHNCLWDIFFCSLQTLTTTKDMKLAILTLLLALRMGTDQPQLMSHCDNFFFHCRSIEQIKRMTLRRKMTWIEGATLILKKYECMTTLQLEHFMSFFQWDERG